MSGVESARAEVGRPHRRAGDRRAAGVPAVRPAVRDPSLWSPLVTTYVEIHAGPFAKLRDALGFMDRVKEVTGVRDVRLDRWVAGQVTLLVRHRDSVPIVRYVGELQEAASTDAAQRQAIHIEVRPRA